MCLMKRTKIVTHYGKAHRDEFLACCAILFSEYRNGRQCYIERRVVSSSDLASRDIWVVDSGERYDPDALNFDHHQMGVEMCSLDMVLKFLLGDHCFETYQAVSPWLKSTAVHDNEGAQNAAEKLNLDFRAYMATRSPIEKFVLDRFAESMIIQPDTYLMLLMKDIGRMLISSAEELTETLPSLLADTPTAFDHNGVRVWDVRNVTSDDAAVMAVMNQEASRRGVDMMISSASRTQGGAALYRQPWAKSKIDLGRVKDHPSVKFTHKNGYYAVTLPNTDDGTIMAIITAATI